MRRHASARFLGWSVLALFSAVAAESQTLAVAPDSPRWKLEGQARPAEYLGRPCLRLDGGGATVEDFEMRDGVIDVDVATPAKRGFFGIQFRIAPDDANGEWVYLRQHKSGLPDAMQYTPILGGGLNWQIYNGQGFTGAVDIPKDAWFHLRLQVTGAQAKLYVGDMDTPALVMDDLKSGIQKGRVALAVLIGETYFSNFEVRTTPQVAWERHLPPMPAGTLTRWSISPSLDALARDLEAPLAPSEIAAMSWQDVEAEPPVSSCSAGTARPRISVSRSRATSRSAWSRSPERRSCTRRRRSSPIATRSGSLRSVTATTSACS